MKTRVYVNSLTFSPSFQFLDPSSNNSRALLKSRQQCSLINSRTFVSTMSRRGQMNRFTLDCFPRHHVASFCVFAKLLNALEICANQMSSGVICRAVEMSRNLVVCCGQRLG